MAEVKSFDLAVVGSGPGGYVAAIKAAREGLSTALIESDRLGGVCLNWGCIPSKALLRSAQLYEQMLRARDFGLSAAEIRFDWEAIVKRSRQISDRTMRGVEYLMKKNEIAVLKGRGVLLGEGRIRVERENEQIVRAKNTVLATGACARSLPAIEIDGNVVITSREALVLQHIPESIVIVGGGATGMEFAYLFSTFGTKVTVVELLERVLPQEDAEVSEELQKIYRKKGMRLLTGAKVDSIVLKNSGAEVKVKSRDDSETVECDKVLIAVGVTGNIGGLGLDEAGVSVESGFIKVDESYRTSAPGIWAIGDCIGPPLVAHAASREGIEAVNSILGRQCRYLKPELVPSCTYCQPQVASVGITEAAAKERGYDTALGHFPFRPLGKALAMGEPEGFVKVVADKKSGKILGVHILGSEATEMIPEASLARWLDSTAADIHNAVHPHPTLSEALMEAASDSFGMAIHL